MLLGDLLTLSAFTACHPSKKTLFSAKDYKIAPNIPYLNEKRQCIQTHGGVANALEPARSRSVLLERSLLVDVIHYCFKEMTFFSLFFVLFCF
jgi:hypothetical protein